MFPYAAILQQDITEYILDFVNYSGTIQNMREIINNLITCPTSQTIIAAIYKLAFIKTIQLKEGSEGKLKMNEINWNDITEGKITLLGKTLLKFRSVGLLHKLAIVFSHYIKYNSESITNEIIKLVAILEVSEGNLENLFYYKNKDTPIFLKEMKPYSVSNSDHLTILNIYNEYYLKNLDNFLNKKKFMLIDKRILELTKMYESIDLEIYENINKKYELIKLYAFENINDAILYCLSKSYKFNRLKKVDEEEEMYETEFFLSPVKGICDFCNITKRDKIKKNSKIICNESNNVFGKKKFNIISII